MACKFDDGGGKLRAMSAYRDPQGTPAPSAPDSATLHQDARGLWWVRMGQRNHRVSVHQEEDGTWAVTLDGVSDRWAVHGLREQMMERMGLEDAASAASKELLAPMPGKVIDVLVAEGQSVSEGDPMLVLEAMKMENVLRAAGDGQVGTICVSAGDAVEKGAVLVALAD